MKQMRKRTAICAALALALMLTGCRGRGGAAASQVHIKDYAGVPAYVQPVLEKGGAGGGAIDPNERVQVDIWVDGTPSMAGFVAGDLATTYRKTLPRVEETAYNTWINAGVNYYRFEVSLLPEDFAGIAGMEEHLASSGQTIEAFTRGLYAFAPIAQGAKVRAYEEASFYSKTTYFENYTAGEGSVMQAAAEKVKAIAAVNWDSQALPPLRTALTMADPDHLTVIVTDLYEEKGMVEKIGNLMTERFFSSGKTVAVLGIQSEFAGLIYDIGESDLTIGYGVDENRKFAEYKPHPFYLLMIGDENQVNYFANALKSRLDSEITDNEVYASNLQLMKTGNWGDASDFTEITGFAADGTLTAQTKKDQQKLDAGQVCDLRYTLPRATAAGRGQSATPEPVQGTLSFEFTVPVRVLSDKDVDFSSFTYTGEAQVQRTALHEVASGRRGGRGEVQDTGEGLPITASIGSSKYAGDFVDDEEAAALVREVAFVSAGAAQRDGDELTCPVTFRVTMDAPGEIGIYRMKLGLTVQCPADLFPTDLEPWVGEWDISVADELNWIADPAAFDGSKTLYLKRIMNQIVVSSNTLKTTGENALTPTHELASFYVDLYVDEQGYFAGE
jgi:hypothetical protein